MIEWMPMTRPRSASGTRSCSAVIEVIMKIELQSPAPKTSATESG